MRNANKSPKIPYSTMVRTSSCARIASRGKNEKVIWKSKSISLQMDTHCSIAHVNHAWLTSELSCSQNDRMSSGTNENITLPPASVE